MQAVKADQAVAARVSADAPRSGGREHRPRRRQASRLARVADERQLRRRRSRSRGVPRVSHAARAPHVGRHHVVDVRFRRARLRAHRSRQRDEQQLVVRGHPRHQSVRRAAAAARTARACSARSISRSSSRRRSAITRISTGTSSARSSRYSRGCSTTSSTSTACRCRSSATRSSASAATAWVSWASAPRSRCSACATARRSRSSSPRTYRASSRSRVGRKALELAKEKGAGADPARGVRRHRDDAAQAPRDGRRRLEGRPEDSGPHPAQPLQPLHAARARGRAGARRAARAAWRALHAP